MPQRMIVEIPTPQVRETGLLAVVDPERFTAPHMAQGVLIEQDVLGVARFTSAGCVTALPGDVTKTFEGGGADIEADPFAIYYGVECAPFGWERFIDKANAGLQGGQGVAIERGFQQVVLNPNAINLTPGATTGATPTPGTAVKPKTAVGILEQYAGANYAGTPVFHVSKFGAVFLPLEAAQDGKPIRTKQDTPIANGAGYVDNDGPGTFTAGANEFWLYVSGQPHLWWSDIVINLAHNLRGNQTGALAERIVVGAVEQFVAAILVTTEGA